MHFLHSGQNLDLNLTLPLSFSCVPNAHHQNSMYQSVVHRDRSSGQHAPISSALGLDCRNILCNQPQHVTSQSELFINFNPNRKCG